MGHDEIESRYQELREQLDLAYRAPEWDSRRIDAIADAMRPLEQALAGRQPGDSILGGHRDA